MTFELIFMNHKYYNKIKNALLIILPALIVSGLVFSANLYFDVDMGSGRIMTWDDQEFKGTVYLGAMEFGTDSGEIQWINMPVTTTTASLAMSYTAKIDEKDILTVYSEADGAGSVENLRVGIATTTPEYTLDVNGDLRVVSTSTLAAIDSGVWQGTEVSPAFGGTGLTSFSPGDILFATSSTEFYRLGMGSEGQTLTVSSDNIPVWLSVLGRWTQTDNYLYPNELFWQVGIGTSTPQYALDVDGDFRATGTSTFSGNVGIATDSPSYELEVDGTARMTEFRMATGASSTYVLTSDSQGYGTWQELVAGEGDISGSGTANYLVRFTGSTAITDSLIYDSGTKIGIGTSTVSAKLNVYEDENSQIRLSYSGSHYSDFAVDSDGDLAISPSSGNLFVRTDGVQNNLRVYSTSTDYISLTHSGTAGALSVNGSENVEIVNPNSTFFVEMEEITYITATSSDTALTVTQNSTGNVAEFKNDTGTAFAITYTGNVGIGTESPEERLSIANDGKMYWQDYGGGWFMEDTSYVQTISDKSVMVRDGNLEICSGGACPSPLYSGISGSGNLLAQYGIEIAEWGIKMNTQEISRPECATSTRGLRWTSSAGGSEKNSFHVCLLIDGEYVWTLSAGEDYFNCGDDITFTYRGSEVTYGTVEVDYGGAVGVKCWMDRNLGATRVAEIYNDGESDTDSSAYGDLFQWGRLDDGHQDRESGETALEETSDDNVPGHSDFILTDTSPYDWRIPQNHDLWQGKNGPNNPCPPGWRIPTEAEWDAERQSWSENNYHGAIASPLKLPAAGYRSRSTGSLLSVGTNGYYWSSTVSGTGARTLSFYGADADMYSDFRAYGSSVRCLQD